MSTMSLCSRYARSVTTGGSVGSGPYKGVSGHPSKSVVLRPYFVKWKTLSHINVFRHSLHRGKTEFDTHRHSGRMVRKCDILSFSLSPFHRRQGATSHPPQGTVRFGFAGTLQTTRGCFPSTGTVRFGFTGDRQLVSHSSPGP